MTATEIKDRLLRGIGYITRPVVYLCIIGWFLWIRPTQDPFSQPLASITFNDIARPFLWLAGVIWTIYVLIEEGPKAHIDLEDWGRIGIGLVGVAALATLWFVYG
jgi:hypothetical protein